MSEHQLTKHFTLKEALASKTATARGLDNTPSPEELATIHRTAIKLEQVREILGQPMIITSWFRSEEVNKAVGGVPNSQHRFGEAVDFVCTKVTPAEICAALRKYRELLGYDQLILEPSWVHISFLTARHSRDREPRRQYLDLSK